MRPMPAKFEDAQDAAAMMQQKQQKKQHPLGTNGNGAGAFSPARRVGARGGPQLFAQKLFTLVEEEDSEIVEWLPDGLAFRVKDIHRFSCEVLEKYFNHSKFTSFQRQLNLYQFKRRKGAHAGAFHHPSFRRGQRHLLCKVRRQKVKRDLAVEARAAQRLAHAKGGSSEGDDDDDDDTQLFGRGRSRTAAQADLRPLRRRRPVDDDNDDDVYVSEEDDVFAAAAEAGSRRSALRRRVDDGPVSRGGGGIGARFTQDSSNGNEGSNDDAWPAENTPRGGAGLKRFSSSDDDDDRLAWGGGYNNNSWRQQVPSSPERSPRELHHVSASMTMTPASDYDSPSSAGVGGGLCLDRTPSVGSSMASSLSFTSSPSHSEVMLHSSSPYQFNDSDNGGHSESTNFHSPMSIHSPVEQAVAHVHEAAAAPSGNQVTPAQQRQRDNDLSLAAVVDAAVGWNSPHQPSSLSHLEHFGWGDANVAVDAGSPWSDPAAASGVPHHHQAFQGSPHQEDFGFIDLFVGWDSAEVASPSSASPIDSMGMPSSSSTSSSSDGSDVSGGSSGGGGSGGNSNGGGKDHVSVNDTFLRGAQAAGAFVDDFLVPRSSGGAASGFGGLAGYA